MSSGSVPPARSAAAAPEVVLHVGVGPSGAVVDRVLTRLGPQLRETGLQYVALPVGDTPLEVPDRGGDRLLAVACSSPADTAQDAPVPAGPFGLADLVRPRPDEIATLVGRLGAGRARVVLSSVRQDRLVEYAYLDALARGATRSLAEMFPDRLEPALDYYALAAAYRDLPEVSDVRVLPFELAAGGMPAFTLRFLELAEVAQPDLTRLAGLREPRVYDKTGVRLALAMNPFLDAEAERDRVRSFLVSNYSRPVSSAPRLLSPDERGAMLRAYRAVNAGFFRTFAPEFGDAAYAGSAGAQRLASTLTRVRVPTPAAAGGPAAANGRSGRSALLGRAARLAGGVRRRLSST